ncbi:MULTISPECIES: E2 domain-associated cysteine-rich protein [Pseudomonas]|uniref:E2 domain-associated cysteine-rich protein n=1 Tax=Pseudomonas TaxID=286 RepID=UPI0014308CE3|nr:MULTISPECIES: E2 domain-associated cysteine-rich protein [Pseudomonas]NJJ59483.1 hypothetical protein [Pseudomonas sp. B14(2022)]NWC30637.1 hypothetical protein [Pseudomonas tolaasii]
MITAIDLIEQLAPDFGGSCARITDSSSLLDLPIQLVDGRVLHYRLLLQQNGERLSAREEAPVQLPAFCPERHINYDGTFCLYFPAASQLTVTDSTSAVVWFETLYKYLKLQERARVQRKWPNADAWAHGGAAHHQLRALKAASALNNNIAAAVAGNQVQLTRRRSNNRSILEIWIHGVHVYSVWENHKRVINQRKRCFCKTSGLRRPKRLRRCIDHAKHASELALAMRDWEDEEKRYWDSIHGVTCCGSCDSCPLPRKS